MADRELPSASRPEDLRSRVRERLSALKGELERLRFETDRRWGELLTALGQAIPPALKIQTVEATRAPAPAAPGAPPGTALSENVLRIEAVTPIRPGSPPLLEVAQFMAGLMREPAVNKRFQLRSWDIKPGAGSLLSISIVLGERVQ